MPGPEPPTSSAHERPTLPPRPGGAASLLGTTIGDRYRLDSILGEGGMGTVYAAEHTLMRKRVAVKVLHPDMGRVPDVVARFEREAMAAGHIDHPNVAAATDFGQLPDGSFFLVLELVEGESLRDVIARGHLSVDRAIHISTQITNALSRAHSLGVVHRDLKPDNVMLITRGADSDFVKVLDFGIAKVPVLELGAKPPPSSETPPATSSAPARVLTKMGMIYGTPAYMAPEQALGQPIDGRADLYAVGVLLFEMLTGRRPFDDDNMATLLGLQVTAPVPPMSDVAPDVSVPSSVEAIVRRLLAKDAAQRFATADDLADALTQSRRVTLPSEPPAALAPERASRDAVSGGHIRTPAPLGGSSPKIAFPGGVRALVVTVVVLAVLAVGLGSSALRSDHVPQSASTSQATTGPIVVLPSVQRPEATASAAPAPAPEDPVANAIAAADVALGKKDPAAVITTVAPLEAANADRIDVHRVLERAYALSRDRAAALREADLWLSLDPSASSDLALQTDVGEAATRPDVAEAAVNLLATRLGAPGVDILYDLAYAPHQPSRRARAALDRPDVRAHAGPAASILLDLRAATTCEAKHALLPRAKADADHRAIAVLQPWTSLPCLRKDGSLTEAIAAAKPRATML